MSEVPLYMYPFPKTGLRKRMGVVLKQGEPSHAAER